MKELKDAFVVWLTKEKPPEPQMSTAEAMSNIVMYVTLTIVWVVAVEFLFFVSVCR